MKRATLTLLTLTLTVLLAAPAPAQEAVNERRQVVNDATIEIHNVAGEVTVRGWPHSEVEVTGTLGRGTDGLKISGDERRLEIRVELPRNARNVDGSELTVNVPTGASVVLQTVSAEADVDEVEGRVRVQTVSGEVRIAGRPSEAEAQSVSGDVTVESIGPIRAQSVSGDVIVRSADGEVEASAVSGNVRVESGRITGARLKSTSGDIRLSAELDTAGRYELESLSGSVVLEVPASFPAAYDISTFSGDIENGFGPAPERTSKYAPGSTLEFTTASGGAEITAKSFSGTVTIRNR